MAEQTQVLVELTQFSLHALRASNGVVQAAGECALENKVAMEALLDAVCPERKEDGLQAVATVWPASMSWYLSTDTEAMLDRTAESFRAIAAGKQKDTKGALAYSACGALDGGEITPEGMDKWLLAFTSLGALEKASTGLLDLKVDPVDVTPSAFSGIGAISAALRAEGKGGAVVLWDLGTERSSLLLVTAKGVEGAVPCAIGMDGIIEAVQTALKLKFRGAGARLFFNDSYDFTDPGPRIAALVAPAIKEALGLLPDAAGAPALACFGLTGKQIWFVHEVASVAGITNWQPDLAKLASALGITFAEGAEASLSSASCGLLGLLAAKVNSRNEWNPAWVEAEAQADEPAPAPEPEPEPEPEPIVRPLPPPARPRPAISIETTAAGSPPRPPRSTVTPRAVAAPPAPAQSPSRSSEPPIPPRPVAPASPPPHSAPAPSFAAPLPPSAPPPPPVAPPAPSFGTPSLSFPPITGVPAPAPVPSAPPAPRAAPPPAPPPVAPPPPQRPPSFSSPGFPVPEPEARPAMPAPSPTPAGTTPPIGGMRMGALPPLGTPPGRLPTTLPFDALKPKPVPAEVAAPPPVPEASPEPKSKVGFFIAIGVVASIIAAGIAVVLEAHKAKTDAYDLEQQEELAHHNADLLLKEQEKKAKDDAERARKEMEAEVEQAKKQAEEDTRRAVLAEVEAARLAKLPGTLLITTAPAGADVSIDGAPALKSPVKADGLAAGNHRVQISLQGYDPVEMTSEIKGSKTTDLGSVALQASYGSLDLTSTPDGLDFALRPAADPTGNPVRTGKTPASIGDIVHGDYLVTFSRSGCRDHVEKVTVQKGVKSPVDTKYVDGSLELTSDPSGATVSQDGTFLGTTPLVLHDLTPRTASFDLTLPGYDPTPVSCDIPEGQTLKYSAQLLRKDRVFMAAEVKTPPESVESPPPVLSPSQHKIGAEVLISLVVRRDGSVSDVRIVKSTDDDVGRRCKAAVEKWKFRPATAPDDRRVDAAVEVPFKFTATSK